jgi:hypothetical protein
MEPNTVLMSRFDQNIFVLDPDNIYHKPIFILFLWVLTMHRLNGKLKLVHIDGIWQPHWYLLNM